MPKAMQRVFTVGTCIAIAVIAAGTSHGGDKKPQEIKGWGKVVDPDGDCTFRANNGKLTITVPGTNHDLNPRLNTKAPRVMRTIEGDFVATVKVTGEFDPGEKVSKPSAVPLAFCVWTSLQELQREQGATTGRDQSVSFPRFFA